GRLGAQPLIQRVELVLGHLRWRCQGRDGARVVAARPPDDPPWGGAAGARDARAFLLFPIPSQMTRAHIASTGVKGRPPQPARARNLSTYPDQGDAAVPSRANNEPRESPDTARKADSMGTDTSIEAAVEQELVSDPLLDASDIVVEVTDGAVSLTGTVP